MLIVATFFGSFSILPLLLPFCVRFIVAFELFEILVPRLETDRWDLSCMIFLFLDCLSTLVFNLFSCPIRLFCSCFKSCTFKMLYDAVIFLGLTVANEEVVWLRKTIDYWLEALALDFWNLISFRRAVSFFYWDVECLVTLFGAASSMIIGVSLYFLSM